MSVKQQFTFRMPNGTDDRILEFLNNQISLTKTLDFLIAEAIEKYGTDDLSSLLKTKTVYVAPTKPAQQVSEPPNITPEKTVTKTDTIPISETNTTPPSISQNQDDTDDYNLDNLIV